MITPVSNSVYTNAFIEDKAQQFVNLGLYELFGIRLDTFLIHSDLIMDNIGAIISHTKNITPDTNNADTLACIKTHWNNIKAFNDNAENQTEEIMEEIMNGQNLPHFLRRQAD